MPGRRTQRRRAIVLDRTKLAEQDLILTMISVEGEQLRVVAKGARKPGSRLAARTDFFCDVDLLLSQGRGMPIVSEAATIDAHEGVRADVDRLSCASAMAETARLTCYENMEDAYLHPVLARALEACAEAGGREHLDLACAAYVFKVLSHCGWRPVLDECVACGEPDATRFSVSAGGVVCESCAREAEGAEPLAPGELDWLRALISCTFDTLMATPVDAHTATTLALMAHRWAATHLDSRLRAMEFFCGL